jgi:hypothetical protein
VWRLPGPLCCSPPHQLNGVLCRRLLGRFASEFTGRRAVTGAILFEIRSRVLWKIQQWPLMALFYRADWLFVCLLMGVHRPWRSTIAARTRKTILAVSEPSACYSLY